MRLEAVVAVDVKGAIGYTGSLPWPRMPRDLQHLKALTTDRTVIVGRKTFEGMQAAYAASERNMPGRRYIVLTRQPMHKVGHVITADALSVVTTLCQDDAEPCMVIGGATVFALCLPLVQRVHLTAIFGTFKADTWFDKALLANFRATAMEDHQSDAKNPYACSFLTYDRN